MPQYRREKIGDQLHAFLAEELRSLRDPRLQAVTFTEVKLAGDLKSAKVFWSALPGSFAGTDAASFLSKQEVKEISAALNKASGALKRRVGESLKLRNVPELNFVFDKTVESGARIDSLLNSISSADGGE